MSQLLLSPFRIFCFILVLSYTQCDDSFIVWYDDLDGIINSNWIITGSTNSTHSNYCPSSNNCLQIQSQSSITTSISTENYLNFTLIFGITIIDKLSSQSTIQNNHDYCHIYYKINTPHTNPTSQNWNLVASYSYDTTTDFRNKLPSQSYKLPLSNNQYVDSIDLQFINTGNTSNSNVLCYIDQISLLADYYNAPSTPFSINLLYLVIGLLATIICTLIICLLWFYFRFFKAEQYEHQLKNIDPLQINAKRVISISSADKTANSTGRFTFTTPISVDLAGSYQTQNDRTTNDEASLLEQEQEQYIPTVNDLHTKISKSLSKIQRLQQRKKTNESDIIHEDINVVGVKIDNCTDVKVDATSTPEFIGSASTNTQVKLNNIMNEVLNDNLSEDVNILSDTTNTQVKLNNIVNQVLNNNVNSNISSLVTEPTKTPPNINEESVNITNMARMDLNNPSPSINAITKQKNTNNNTGHNSVPSSRRVSCTQTITAFQPERDREIIALQLTSYDLYEEEAKNGKIITPTPINEMNDDLDFKSIDSGNSFLSSSTLPMPSNMSISNTFTITRYHTNKAIKEENEHSLSFADNESFVSANGLKNRYPPKTPQSPMSNGLSTSKNYITQMASNTLPTAQFYDIPEMSLLDRTTDLVTEDEDETKSIHLNRNNNNMIQDDISYVSYFDNKGNNDSNKKIRVTKYMQNEEESLDIGSVVTAHTIAYDNNYTVSPIPESQNNSRMSQSNNKISFNAIESQKL